MASIIIRIWEKWVQSHFCYLWFLNLGYLENNHQWNSLLHFCFLNEWVFWMMVSYFICKFCYVCKMHHLDTYSTWCLWAQPFAIPATQRGICNYFNFLSMFLKFIKMFIVYIMIGLFSAFFCLHLVFLFLLIVMPSLGLSVCEEGSPGEEFWFWPWDEKLAGKDWTFDSGSWDMILIKLIF